MTMFDSVFNVGDAILDYGGQTALDVVNLIPGYGEVASGVQAGYHGLHALNDLANGNTEGAAAQGMSTLWYGANAIPGVHEALEPFHVGELGYDAITNGANIGGSLAAGNTHPFPTEGTAGLTNEHGRMAGASEALGGLLYHGGEAVVHGAVDAYHGVENWFGNADRDIRRMYSPPGVGM